MLAKARGNLAKNYDFIDDIARCIIIVGLPFKSINQITNFSKDYHRKMKSIQDDRN